MFCLLLSGVMAKKDPHAMAMVRKRMEKLSPERRKEIAQKAAATRWKDHEPKRPASSRKKP
jgi:hypothetical protein